MLKAKALVCDADQQFRLAEVGLPEPGTNELVIRTTCSGVSIGTELALVRNKISWGPYPLATGYQAVGVVESVGREVTGFEVGDRVYTRRNRAISFPDGAPVSSVFGTHCSRIVLDVDPADTHGVARLPEGVSDEAASLFVMPAVGLYGVDMAGARLGETAVVYGVGLIGLGVVAACRHRGVEVIAVDIEPGRLDVARKLGADHLIDGRRQDVKAEVERITPGGAHAVFESTGIPECIDQAVPLCRHRGRFIFQGNYGAAPISFHFLPAHERHVTAYFPCDDGYQPCRRAVLNNMATGALCWDKTITHRVPAAEAPGFYDRINRGDTKDVIGAVLRWSE
jgi:L-iditol 2-dehydrogenase